MPLRFHYITDWQTNNSAHIHHDAHSKGGNMKSLTRRVFAPAVLLGLLACAGLAQAQTQGVSKNEIVLGSIQDLSGPIAGFGKQARNGLIMRTEEINEAGGVQGRKLKLLVE